MHGANGGVINLPGMRLGLAKGVWRGLVTGGELLVLAPVYPPSLVGTGMRDLTGVLALSCCLHKNRVKSHLKGSDKHLQSSPCLLTGSTLPHLYENQGVRLFLCLPLYTSKCVIILYTRVSSTLP